MATNQPTITYETPDWSVSVLVGPPAPVQVCQLEAEFGAVLDLYRDEQPKRVLEIGTAAGGTLFHFLQNASEGAWVVSVDWNDSEASYKVPDQDTLERWTPPGVRCVMVDGDSHSEQTQAEIREFGPFDWVFIDGAHTLNDCLQDWEDYREMTVSGGLVLFHDIALRRDYGDGEQAAVWRVWRDIQASGLWTREFRAHPYLPEYGIGCVRLP